jgi:hypothetical protein
MNDLATEIVLKKKIFILEDNPDIGYILGCFLDEEGLSTTMKVLNSKIHGIIDYLVVAFLLLSPSLFALPNYSSTFSYTLGGIHLLLTIFTILN